MSQNKAFRFGPQSWSGTSAVSVLQPPTIPLAAGAGILNGGTFTGNVVYQYTFIKLFHIRVVNTTGSNALISLGINPVVSTLVAANCGFWYQSIVPPTTSGENWLDWTGNLRLDVGDFLTVISSVTTALTIMGEGEIGIF